jgi:YfiH family protein
MLGAGIRLYFTDRNGGVSPPPFDTLNLAYHTGDDADNVIANRGIVAGALGIPPQRFVHPQQVHGVRVVRAGAAAGREKEKIVGEAYAATDGVYTGEAGLALGVLTADCVPLAIAVPGSGMVAMLHAGWRGTIADIAGIALREMAGGIGLDLDDVRVVMGPAISRCCYEVDEGRARLFVEKYGRRSGVVSGGKEYRLDLFRANHINLRKAGVKDANISSTGKCTCCEGRYFSYRRDGETGRQGAYVFMV